MIPGSVNWDLRERTGTDVLSGWTELRCSRLLADSSCIQSFISGSDLVIFIVVSVGFNAKWVTVAMADIWRWRQSRQCWTTVQHQRWIMIKWDMMIWWDMEWWFVDCNSFPFAFISYKKCFLVKGVTITITLFSSKCALSFCWNRYQAMFNFLESDTITFNSFSWLGLPHLLVRDSSWIHLLFKLCQTFRKLIMSTAS